MLVKSLACLTCLAGVLAHVQLPAFTPHAAFGNTIHIATADFDGVGFKDHVVTSTIEGDISAFARITAQTDPTANNRLWSVSPGAFAVDLVDAKLSQANGTRAVILAPAVDGHLRAFDSKGNTVFDISVGSGATYTAGAGFTAMGASRVVAGGVDGHLYIYDGAKSPPTQLHAVNYGKHNATSIVRRVIVGNFDGEPGDELAVFWNTGGFAGGGFFSFLDLTTLAPPTWWNTSALGKLDTECNLGASDDVTTLGWTDKQLPAAYDLDGDGMDELVAHWGVLHPTTCSRNLYYPAPVPDSSGAAESVNATTPKPPTLSHLLARGEALNRGKDYDKVHPFTDTNKYIMQRGVPGKFTPRKSTHNSASGMVMVYGDDLYHLSWTPAKEETLLLSQERKARNTKTCSFTAANHTCLVAKGHPFVGPNMTFDTPDGASKCCEACDANTACKSWNWHCMHKGCPSIGSAAPLLEESELVPQGQPGVCSLHSDTGEVSKKKKATNCVSSAPSGPPGPSPPPSPPSPPGPGPAPPAPTPASASMVVDDYAYAHTLFHFQDGARLESRPEPRDDARDGGDIDDTDTPLDKLVLVGPNNGDDQFYVVDLALEDGAAWREQALKLDTTDSALLKIRSNLEAIAQSVSTFDGNFKTLPGRTPTPPGSASQFTRRDKIAWVEPLYDCQKGFKASGTAATQILSQCVADLKTMTLDYLNTTAPKRIVIFPDLSLDVDKKITPEQAISWSGVLAKAGVPLHLKIGHGDRVFISPETAAAIFKASIVNGSSLLVFATKELKLASYPLVYAPLMDAVAAAAKEAKLPPAQFMLAFKGAVLTSMNATSFHTLQSKYAHMVILGAEDSNVRMNEWSVSERASLWLTGQFSDWGCGLLGDTMASNRISEWSAMRNGHVILRQLLSTYFLGATMFRTDASLPKDNPLFLRNVTTDPSLRFASPYRHGVVPFLRMIENGVVPLAASPQQMRGIAPVAIALPKPTARFQEQSVNHLFDIYKPEAQLYAVNSLQCWDAYQNVPDVDITAIAHGSMRRWDSLIPHSPAGFVPLVPYSSVASLEKQNQPGFPAPWIKKAFETDANSWSAFPTLAAARDSIAKELLAQRDTTSLIRVLPTNASESSAGGGAAACFHQIIEANVSISTTSTSRDSIRAALFMVLIDPNTLSPADRRVTLRLGGSSTNAGGYDVFDQLGNSAAPIGSLVTAADGVNIVVPAGAVRILVLLGK